jgi:large subunit ribosomal protein L13
MNTTHTPSLATVTPTWYVVDAKGQRLGRLATKVARLLRGKDKPIYTPFLDTGDYVIVINAKEVEVTGKKRSQKLYRRHSGRPGGMKVETFAQLQARLPERIIEEAVWGMLPKNRLGRALFTKLRVYPGPEHPHAAQKPQVLQLEAV